MAAAGYDVAHGDTWVLNELTTAVRRGDGNARANIREFLRGLYEGDGTRPTKGAVFVIGFGQRTGDVSVVPGHVAELARGLGVLDGHGDVRQRLVAGGVRRRPQLRRSRPPRSRPAATT